jgi:hypothetical protein
MRRGERHPARRLRASIEALPQRTKEAMLRGIDANRIVVGTYVDPESGGICPMLAAHRNGGRTSLASFAHAWDRYTGARGRPRPASDRELHTLTAMLEASIALDELPELQDVAREAQKRRLPRLFHRFDEYERAVAELGVIRALNPQDERIAPQAPRTLVRS